jgi:hypothetical protein
MTFEELLDQAIALLQRRGRLTDRALKRQFNVDDDYLADLKAELIYAEIGRKELAHSEMSAAIALYRAMGMTFWLPQAEAALAEKL